MNEWTNEALHPSLSRERGVIDTKMLLNKLGVPDCATLPLASKIVTQTDSKTLFVGNTTIASANNIFEQEMHMTFRKDNIDYVTKITPKLAEPVFGEIYTYNCDMKNTYIGYMPKCQNLALLQPKALTVIEKQDKETYALIPHNQGLPGSSYSSQKSISVDTFGSFLLLLLGLAVFGIYWKIGK